MEEILCKLPYYVITTQKKDEFLCHGVESKFGRTNNIHHAVKIWPKKKVESVIEELKENNPLTDLVNPMFIFITYSINVDG